MKKPENSEVIVAEDEISLLEIFGFMWSKKWFVAKVTGIFIVLGIIQTLISPNEYTVEVS